MAYLSDHFADYCRKLGLTIEQGGKQGEKYITAKAGTVYLAENGRKAGDLCAIMVNGGDGTIYPAYGFVSKERMSGYFDAVITDAANAFTEKPDAHKLYAAGWRNVYGGGDLWYHDKHPCQFAEFELAEAWEQYKKDMHKKHTEG